MWNFLLHRNTGHCAASQWEQATSMLHICSTKKKGSIRHHKESSAKQKVATEGGYIACATSRDRNSSAKLIAAQEIKISRKSAVELANTSPSSLFLRGSLITCSGRARPLQQQDLWASWQLSSSAAVSPLLFCTTVLCPRLTMMWRDQPASFLGSVTCEQHFPPVPNFQQNIYNE